MRKQAAPEVLIGNATPSPLHYRRKLVPIRYMYCVPKKSEYDGETFCFFVLGINPKEKQNFGDHVHSSFFISVLLRHNWHITLCKCKMYNVLIATLLCCKMITTIALADSSIMSIITISCVCVCVENI